MKTLRTILLTVAAAAAITSLQAYDPGRIADCVLAPDGKVPTGRAALTGMAARYASQGGAGDSVRASLLYRRAAASARRASAAEPKVNTRRPAFDAIVTAAIMTDRGRLSHADSLTLRELYTKASEAGSTEGMTRLGALIADTAASRALVLLRKAADSGNAEAAWRYGTLLSASTADESQKAVAESYINTASDMGYPAAMFDLGRRKIASRNKTWRRQGWQLLTEAAARGYGDAQWLMAVELAKGNATDRDYEQAARFMALSMYNGYGRKAMHELTSSGSTLPAAFRTYLLALRKAADGDAATATGLLRSIERKGMNDVSAAIAAISLHRSGATPADSVKAITQLTRLANDGSGRAHTELAELYGDPNSARNDVTLALQHLEKAAEAGYGPALLRLGDAYFEGHLVEPDTLSALGFYARALNAGCFTPASTSRMAWSIARHNDPDSLSRAAALSAAPAFDHLSTLLRIVR